MKKLLLRVSIVLLALFAIASSVNVSAIDSKDIQILATSDVHNRFVAFDYATNSPISSGGLTRVSTKVKELKAIKPNTILIDNGDAIQGNSSMLFLKDPILPMVQGMNALEYDVFVAGNHEFNYGMDVFKSVRDTFNGAFLSANVYEGSAVPANRVTSNYEIVERDGVKVAIIGAVTPHITTWDKGNLEGYTVTSPYDEIGAAIAEIEAGNLADVIIVSFHAAMDGEYENDSALYVAENFNVDAVISGHAHETRVERASSGAPIIAPGSLGAKLAQINITVTFDANQGKYVVADRNTDISANNVVIDKTVAEDPQMVALLDAQHQRALADANEIIGNLSGGNLINDNEIKGIPQAQIADSAMIDLILKVQLQEAQKALPATTSSRHVSGAALFNTKTNVLEGPITRADVSKIYQFDNTLTVLKVDGKMLKSYMEWSATYYNTFVDGDLTVSFDENIRAYNYDMFSGIDYQVDISQPAGSRITNIVYSSDKVALQDSDEIYLTVNNYRANGILSDIPEFANATIVHESAGNHVEAIRDMISNYIIAAKTITPQVDNNWSITGNNYDQNLHQIVAKLVNTDQLLLPTSSDGRTPNVRSIRIEDVNAVTTSIDVLSINDFHGSVLENGKNIGAAKLAAYLLEAKALNPNTVFVSAGDQYQGSAPSNLTKGKIISDIFKEIGFSYSAIGNHEFDWGTDLIPTWQQDGGFEFLAANIVNKKTQQPVSWATPYAIEDINGMKVGIIGISTPDTIYSTLPANVADLDFLDPVATVEKYAALLREQGVDAVIVLSHLSSYQEGDVITGDGALLAGQDELSYALSQTSVDGIITGHSHQYVSGYVNGVPVVQAGYNGRAVGKIHTVFDSNGAFLGTWQEVEQLYQDVANMPVNPEVQAIIDAYMLELEPIMNEVIGTTDAFDHVTSPEVQVTQMGYQIAKMMKEAGGTQIGMINGGGIRKGLEEGNITVGLMYEIFPFDNTLVTVDVTGAHLKELVLHGMFPDGFKSGQLYGITVYYEMDANNLPVITSMRLPDGTQITDDGVYSVTILDFMLSGGDKYDFTNAMNVNNTQVPLRDALTIMIKEEGHLYNNYVNPLILGEDPTVDDIDVPGDIDKIVPGPDNKDLPNTGNYYDIVMPSMLILSSATLAYGASRRRYR